MTPRKPRASPITQRQISAVNNFHSLGMRGEPVEVKAARAKSRDLEHGEQVVVINWWSYACGTYDLPEIALFAIPNGGKRGMITGARLKAEGVRAGVSDLFLAVARGVWHGAFCELKAEKGRLSESQESFMVDMAVLGYRTEVCYGADESIEFIKQYLRG